MRIKYIVNSFSSLLLNISKIRVGLWLNLMSGHFEYNFQNTFFISGKYRSSFVFTHRYILIYFLLVIFIISKWELEYVKSFWMQISNFVKYRSSFFLYTLHNTHWHINLVSPLHLNHSKIRVARFMSGAIISEHFFKIIFSEVRGPCVCVAEG